MSVPHIPWPFVNVVRDDGSVMSPWPVCRPLTWLRTEPVLAHQPQNPHFRGADALVTQARPHLAIALAMEPAVGDDLSDLPDQIGIRHGALWSRAAGRCGLGPGRLQVPVHAGPARTPGPAHPGDAVSLARGDRDDGAHRFDLRRPKGWPTSIFAIFSTRSSLSMVISPTLARSRSISSSRVSRGRCFSPDAPVGR